ncbi:MAG TPA: LysM peptidoglycan-binding domain-containing protein [Lacipirellula sp.]
MSSLRPLLTIMLLAAVGVVLYMKINETEPVVPAGVGEWTAGPLEIGGATAGGKTATTAPPSFAADAAPAFTPSTSGASATTTATADTAGGVAPSWSPGPAAVSDSTKTAPAPAATVESSPIARSAEPKIELPAMPPLPGTTGPVAPEGDSTKEEGPEAPDFEPLVGSAAAATDATAPGDETAPGVGVPGAAVAQGEKPASPATSDPITPTDAAETAAPAKASLYPSVRVAVQADLERGELAQALQRLSEWYGDPSLTLEERQEVETLLSQLAGSVIWEGPPAHRLEPAHIVQAGETLQDIGQKYDVPWQLLAKINGIPDSASLQPGQELKVLRGKFSAIVDLSERTMTLMLDRRYAGKFAIDVDPTTVIEEGQWTVDQKLLTPASGGVYVQASGDTEDKSLLLANPADPAAQAAVLRGPGSSDPASPQPPGRVIRLKSSDVNDVYDILSVGSRVTIRR